MGRVSRSVMVCLASLLGLAWLALSFVEWGAEAEAQQAQRRAPGYAIMCGLSNVGNIDPIVYPNMRSMHEHSIGGGKVWPSSTRTSLLKGPTTCDARADHSGYWLPTRHAASGKKIYPIRFAAYFRAGGITNLRSIRPFPVGYEVVAGDPMKEGPQAPFRWTCGGNNGELATSPLTPYPRNCGKNRYPTLRVTFPNCVEQGTATSEDHKSHATYATGRCPSGFYPVPQLVLAVRYPMYAPVKGGYWAMKMGYHADYQAATVLSQEQEWISKGIRDGSGLSNRETVKMGAS